MSSAGDGAQAPDGAGSAGASAVAVGALTEPTRRVPGLFLALLALANLGIMLAFYGPIQNILPRMSEQIAGSDGKENALAIILGIGVLGSVIGNPLAGALSDRTTSRWGRRRPWLMGGAIVGAMAIGLIPYQSSIVVLTVLWLFVQGAVNSSYAALTATIPDQVPVDQRGVASGLVGLAQTVGIVLGVAIPGMLITSMVGGSTAVAVLLIVFVVPFVLYLKDPRLAREDRPPFVLGQFLRDFWVSPREHPDFAWAWAARFLVQLGSAMATLYLLFFLQDRIGMSSQDAQAAQTGVVGLYALGTILTAVVGGWLSDRSGKRKSFVVWSTVVMASAALLLAAATSLPMTFVAAFILGLGYGWYLAVDQALITQVLPDAADRGRDLGVINIANSLPQVLAPVLAAPLVHTLGGYPALYLATGAVTLLGAVAVMPIRSVR